MKSNYNILKKYIRLIDIRNKDNITDKVLGINIDKFFMPSIANVTGTDLSKYKLITKGKFACNPMHVGRDERLPVALYDEEEPAIVSPAYFMFEIIDNTMLDENYLMMWFRRSEFDRICWLHTDGSVRGGITWDDICRIELPVPSIDKQREIVNSYKVISDRIEIKKKINDNLAQQAQIIYTVQFVRNANPYWRKGHLSDLVTVKYGKDHKKLTNGIYPVYGSGGIIRYVERPLYVHESVLIPRKGTLNNVMYVNEPFWSVDTMFYTEMRQPNIAKFIYHFIKDKDFASMNTGSAVPSMTTDILNTMELAIPSTDCLQNFEKLVTPIYQTMQINNCETAKLINLRNLLISKLMSGKFDVLNIGI
ncbi:MAG: restriction endonuclease subunit S [Ruminococcus sp.]|nr:restriction endonuclease subunit S [Ruminococcus sp.]